VKADENTPRMSVKEIENCNFELFKILYFLAIKKHSLFVEIVQSLRSKYPPTIGPSSKKVLTVSRASYQMNSPDSENVSGQSSPTSGFYSTSLAIHDPEALDNDWKTKDKEITVF